MKGYCFSGDVEAFAHGGQIRLFASKEAAPYDSAHLIRVDVDVNSVDILTEGLVLLIKKRYHKT